MVALTALGVGIGLACSNGGVRALVTTHYGRMRSRARRPCLVYTLARRNGCVRLGREGLALVTGVDPGEILLRLDEDLTIQLQRRRPDLYFVHAAVLERAGAAVMLVARSAGGKSTTAWALSHHGFAYLSDELAPVDLGALAVHPFPRALLLKSRPPAAYPLPDATPSSRRGFHLPVDALPGGIRPSPAAVGVIVFLRYTPQARRPAMRRLGASAAAARLYANALNPLAHPGYGLDAAIRIVRAAACFEMTTTDLAATCALLRATVDRYLAARPRHARPAWERPG